MKNSNNEVFPIYGTQKCNMLTGQKLYIIIIGTYTFCANFVRNNVLQFSLWWSTVHMTLSAHMHISSVIY